MGDEVAAEHIGVFPAADIVVVVAVGSRVQSDDTAAVLDVFYKVLAVLQRILNRLFSILFGHLVQFHIRGPEACGGRVVEDYYVVFFKVFGRKFVYVIADYGFPNAELFAHMF